MFLFLSLAASKECTENREVGTTLISDNWAYQKGSVICYNSKDIGMLAYFLEAKGVEVEFIERGSPNGQATKTTKSEADDQIISYRFPEYGTVKVTITNEYPEFVIKAVIPDCSDKLILNTHSDNLFSTSSITFEASELNGACIFLGAAPDTKATILNDLGSVSLHFTEK